MLERLTELYAEWSRPDRALAMKAELEQSAADEIQPLAAPGPRRCRSHGCPSEATTTWPQQAVLVWSGKKYKHCHLQADKQQDRGGCAPAEPCLTMRRPGKPRYQIFGTQYADLDALLWKNPGCAIKPGRPTRQTSWRQPGRRAGRSDLHPALSAIT